MRTSSMGEYLFLCRTIFVCATVPCDCARARGELVNVTSRITANRYFKPRLNRYFIIAPSEMLGIVLNGREGFDATTGDWVLHRVETRRVVRRLGAVAVRVGSEYRL